jgi:hypothetical protein
MRDSPDGSTDSDGRGCFRTPDLSRVKQLQGRVRFGLLSGIRLAEWNLDTATCWVGLPSAQRDRDWPNEPTLVCGRRRTSRQCWNTWKGTDQVASTVGGRLSRIAKCGGSLTGWLSKPRGPVCDLASVREALARQHGRSKRWLVAHLGEAGAPVSGHHPAHQRLGFRALAVAAAPDGLRRARGPFCSRAKRQRDRRRARAAPCRAKQKLAGAPSSLIPRLAQHAPLRLRR